MVTDVGRSATTLEPAVELADADLYPGRSPVITLISTRRELHFAQ